MKILHVTASMTQGGVQALVVGLTEASTQRGDRCCVVSLALRDEVQTNREVERVSLQLRGGWHQLFGLRKLRRAIREFAPDVVHTHAVAPNVLVPLALLLTGIPIVRTTHSTVEGGSLWVRLFRVTARLSTRDVAISQAVAESDRFVGTFPIVIRNGVDVDRFKFNPADRDQLRSELGLGPECVFVSVGRLVQAKDPDLLVEAFSLVNDLTARLMLVGDGPLRQGLIDRVKELGLEGRVLILGSRHDVPALLAAGDVYVSSAAWEGFGLSMVEALAAGLPVVATDVGGTREAVAGSATLVESRDPGALARAMEQVAASQRKSRVPLLDLETSSTRRMADQWNAVYAGVAR